MSRLVESIKILNGRIFNLASHQLRFDKSRAQLYGLSAKISLLNTIKLAKPPENGLYKCRILYDEKIHDIEFNPYIKPEINQLKIILAASIQYEHKWEERKVLDDLFKLRGKAQEIIIVRNGLVTDGYYFNYVFEKNGILYTPEHPLLFGTQRARLVNLGKIKPVQIKSEDIKKFDFIHAINALNTLGKIRLPISKIIQ